MVENYWFRQYNNKLVTKSNHEQNKEYYLPEKAAEKYLMNQYYIYQLFKL